MLKITVVGAGIVGFSTGGMFQRLGARVRFVDTDARVVDDLGQRGLVAATRHSGDFLPDLAFICVPTPTGEQGVDLSYVRAAVVTVSRAYGGKSCPIVLRSTVPPGTSEGLERLAREYTPDASIVVNPEYLTAAEASEGKIPSWTMVGCDDDLPQGLVESYQALGTVVQLGSRSEGEFHKYVHNLFNAGKISFFNEMREIGTQLGIDAQKVLELAAQSSQAATDPAYGTRNLGPFRGSCLPKDLRGFRQFLAAEGIASPLLDAAEEVNNHLLTREVEAA